MKNVQRQKIIGVLADEELQKAFNELKRRLGLKTSSSIIRYLVMEKVSFFAAKNMSAGVKQKGA